MPEQQVLKGIFKEGPVVASVVITDGKHARILVKGAEPVVAGDTAFNGLMMKVANGVKDAVAKCESRELVAVIEQRPTLIDYITISPDDVSKMGVRWVGVMDRDSGFIVRRCVSEPLGTTVAYTSLKASPLGSTQPGRTDLPSTFKRKPHKELSDAEKQIVGVAVQLSGESLFKLVVFDDAGSKMLGVVWDLPPPRAHSVLFDLDALAKELQGGADINAIAKKLEGIRGG